MVTHPLSVFLVRLHSREVANDNGADLSGFTLADLSGFTLSVVDLNDLMLRHWPALIDGE